MTDASNAVVWKALYEPFGAVHQTTGTASLDMKSREWFQLESGVCGLAVASMTGEGRFLDRLLKSVQKGAPTPAR